MSINDNPLLLTVFIICSISAAVQLFYYLYFYLKPALYKPAEINQREDPVSVIICARNEEENLRNFLPAVLEQDYPDFEVIVVNDCSDDDTFDVLGEFIGRYPNLKVSNITKDPKFAHNKKFAQFIGIKASKNELMLFIDADCRPESKNWLGTMVSHFNAGTDFVLGYGGYLIQKGFLNKYIRHDSMFIAIQYLGMALRGMPYMGVGRNLAYRRSLFFSKKGFSGHSHLASGDDDLFVNSNSTKDNVAVEFRKEAHTRSVPATSTRVFYKQKKRHFTTAVHYKFRDKLFLTVEPASRILFYVSFIILVSFLFLLPAVIGIFVIRLAVQTVILAINQKKFNEPGLLPWSLLFDIIAPFINSVIFISNFGQDSRKIKWN